VKYLFSFIEAIFFLSASFIVILSEFRAAQLFAVGVLFCLTNFYILKWSWSNILNKKLVALSVGVIVFKYSFFVAIIYFVIRNQLNQISWFAIGFTSALVATIGKHIFLNIYTNKHEELCH